ncbi:MAG: glycosyltransferase family 2 protein [Bryobacterales bacterium]|nr:glycosyltransferase family 2 protein [Bryobacterales bacterium]
MPGSLVTLIIPCYNEIDGLPQLMRRLHSMHSTGEMAGWEVLFINDGSKDGTKEALNVIAKDNDWVRVVHHDGNKGLGAAVRTGFANAIAPVVCTMDSDCTFAPETLPKMVKMLNEGADIVTASPWHPESGAGSVHPVRKILSQGASWVYRKILRNDIHSFTPMHRAYRREVVKKVKFESNGFAAIAEIMVRAMFHGFRVKELPMPVDRRQFGESKINIYQSITAHLSLMRLAGWTTFTMWADAKLAGGRFVIEE